MRPRFKVSVVCSTFRPGYIDTLVTSLSQQTLNQDEWEFVLVDDLFNQRREAVKKYVLGKIKNFKHMPPRELKSFFALASAMNTGILHAEGELIYFMNDYIYASPRCLERHYEIYSKYNPKILISGPLIDALVASGQSVYLGVEPTPWPVKENGEVFHFVDPTPPIKVKLKDNFDEVIGDNFISVFAEPFVPPQLPVWLPDWRIGSTTNVQLEEHLFENTTYRGASWWWAGRNDSASLEALFEINGFDENFDGRSGAIDGDTALRMVATGCRYLIDIKAPCFVLTHPLRKRSIISEEDRGELIKKAREKQPIPNDYSLRLERERILKG